MAIEHTERLTGGELTWPDARYRELVLRAPGKPDVTCRLSQSFIAGGPQKLRELEVVLPASEFAKMAKGVAYTLHPVNGKKGYTWAVGDGVAILVYGR